MQALPMLHNTTMHHCVTEELLPERAFNRILKSVLNLSGYFGNAKFHAIHRYLSKEVNGEWS